MIELIFEIIIIGFFSNIVGVYTRYLFYKLIGKGKTIKYLRGESENENNTSKANHILFNTIVGIVVFFILILGIIKLLDILNLL